MGVVDQILVWVAWVALVQKVLAWVKKMAWVEILLWVAWVVWVHKTLIWVEKLA